MENSLIFSFFVHALSYLKEQYKQSKLKYIIASMLNSLEKSQQQSLILNLLGKESKLGSLWKQSIFYRITAVPCIALKEFLSYLWSKTEKLMNHSRIIKAIDKVLSNLFNYSVRSYGVLFFAMSAVEAALWMLFQVNELKYIVFRAAIILISAVMLLLDVPVAALFKGSFVYRFVEKGFVDNFEVYDDSKGMKANNLLLVMVFGAMLGVLASILSFKLVLMAIAGAFAAILILWRYELGVFLAAGFAALLSTTAMFLIMGITIFSFVCRWVVGKVPKYKATPIDALVVLFFIVLSYSTLTSYFMKDSLNVLVVHTLMLAFYFVLTRTINSRYKLYLLVVLLIISASLTSLYGVYQYFGGSATTEAWVDTTMFEDIQSRVGSTFSNPNILGEYLIMMIPLALSLLWYRKKLIYKGIFVAMLGLMGICMIFTFSRGAWLGLMLAMVGFFVVRDKRLFALFLIALFILPFALPPSVINRFTSIGNLQDTSSSYRMSILLGSLRMAQDYWITGIGLGSQGFKAIYPKYSLAAAYAHHAHNIYIQVILEMGVAGALVFMLILLVFIRATLAHQSKTKDAFLSTVMVAACAGIAGYLVQGLVENIWYNYRVLQTFWVVMAVGLCALKLAKGEVLTDD
ncbi:MAG TPA: O-antigen ligase family protein [Patescibacteria group bacterium]|nr:O-antigen ligase family protein [Patescibacteria group bacterium]